MSARVARAVVALAAAMLPAGPARRRYREQWLADVEGAAELGLSPVRVALGAAVTAARIGPPESLPGLSPRFRRRYGLLQLAAAAPYGWAVAYAGYACLRLGITRRELFAGGHDPKDLAGWAPLAWGYAPCMVWLAVGGWVAAALLAPGGLALAAGGRGAARWLCGAGSLAAVAVVPLALSDFGRALTLWLLD